MFAVREVSKEVRCAGLRTVLLGAVCLGTTGIAHGQSAALTGVPRLQQQQKEMASDARQKKMETDAAKLVEMAQQLKTSVDKTNKDVLSVDVINRAAQIEKLAHEVREGMRQ